MQTWQHVINSPYPLHVLPLLPFLLMTLPSPWSSQLDMERALQHLCLSFSTTPQFNQPIKAVN